MRFTVFSSNLYDNCCKKQNRILRVPKVMRCEKKTERTILGTCAYAQVRIICALLCTYYLLWRAVCLPCLSFRRAVKANDIRNGIMVLHRSSTQNPGEGNVVSWNVTSIRWQLLKSCRSPSMPGCETELSVSFVKLNSILTYPPVLGYFLARAPTELRSDASASVGSRRGTCYCVC